MKPLFRNKTYLNHLLSLLLNYEFFLIFHDRFHGNRTRFKLTTNFHLSSRFPFKKMFSANINIRDGEFTKVIYNLVRV